MAKGGVRPGSGRPRDQDREKTKKAILQAIVNKWGSLEEGIKAQFEKGGNEKVQLLLWQHILGVPETEQKLKLSDSNGEPLDSPIIGGKLIVEVVRTEHNKSVTVNASKDDNSLRLSNSQPEANNDNAGGD
jgi:hypothetical protein